MRASSLLGLVWLLALCGCPDPQPPKPPPERPAGVGAGNPLPKVDPPKDPPEDPLKTSPQDAPAGGGREEWIAPRTVRRCCANLAVALGAIRGERAQLTVSSGQVSFRAELAVGERLSLCGVSELELLGLDPKQGARVRWLREVDDPLGETPGVIQSAPDDLRLTPMNLYLLPGGEVIGVGNVREGKVTLSVFPKGYQQDPMQDWDLHRDASVGASLKAAVLPLELVGVEGDGVTLELP